MYCFKKRKQYVRNCFAQVSSCHLLIGLVFFFTREIIEVTASLVRMCSCFVNRATVTLTSIVNH